MFLAVLLSVLALVPVLLSECYRLLPMLSPTHSVCKQAGTDAERCVVPGAQVAAEPVGSYAYSVQGVVVLPARRGLLYYRHVVLTEVCVTDGVVITVFCGTERRQVWY